MPKAKKTDKSSTPRKKMVPQEVVYCVDQRFLPRLLPLLRPSPSSDRCVKLAIGSAGERSAFLKTCVEVPARDRLEPSVIPPQHRGG